MNLNEDISSTTLRTWHVYILASAQDRQQLVCGIENDHNPQMLTASAICCYYYILLPRVSHMFRFKRFI